MTAETADTTGGTSGGDGAMSLGAANGTAQFVAAIATDDNVGTGNNSESYIHSSSCLVVYQPGGTSVSNRASFTSFDADGFTLNFASNGTSTSFRTLVLKGTFRSHIGTQARPTSTGNQDYTTTFQPSAVMLLGTFATASATETVQAHWVMGVSDGTNSHGIWAGDAGSINTDANMYTSASNVYTQATNPSTLAAQTTLSTLSTGYRLPWATADANARLFSHIALASASSSRRPVSPMVFQ
jgi:hypothetical protein